MSLRPTAWWTGKGRCSIGRQELPENEVRVGCIVSASIHLLNIANDRVYRGEDSPGQLSDVSDRVVGSRSRGLELKCRLGRLQPCDDVRNRRPESKCYCA